MEKRYPQEEERGYLGEGRYLLFLARQGTAYDNAMSESEFSRNIWLMDEHDKEIGRIHSDEDDEGFEFTRLTRSHTEYLAHRDGRNGERVFVIDMESGLATHYPDHDYYANSYKGPYLELVKKWETRIYLNKEDYLIMDEGVPGRYKRNIVRINGKGEEVWRIWTAETDGFTFDWLYVLNGKCIASFFDDLEHYLINPYTGEASYIEWEDIDTIYNNNGLSSSSILNWLSSWFRRL